MSANLEQLLEELVRPALRDHGGDVELVSFEDGVLQITIPKQEKKLPEKKTIMIEG